MLEVGYLGLVGLEGVGGEGEGVFVGGFFVGVGEGGGFCWKGGHFVDGFGQLLG